MNTSIDADGSDSGSDNKDGVVITVNNKSNNFMRTIERRGNTYLIRDSLPSEEDQMESDAVEKMIQDLYKETIAMSWSANRKASLFKTINILISLFTIVAGVVVGVSTLDMCSNANSAHIFAIMGFLITAFNTLQNVFTFEKRSVLLKDVANKSRDISRKVKALQIVDMKPKDKLKKVDELYAEVDQLDISIFDNKITISPVTKATNIFSDKSDLHSESDNVYSDRKIKRKISNDKENIELPSVLDKLKSSQA